MIRCVLLTALFELNRFIERQPGVIGDRLFVAMKIRLQL